jgi:tetratricopeptide (TPR) repeat protein
MNALLATAILALLSPQKGTVQVKVNAQNGATITGERTFRVTVQANNPVTGVEFYVGNELRDKDTSTPYEFTIDSLGEQDGNLKLRFKAFTTEGESGEAAVTVKIDNGTSKGLDFHLKAGEEALQESKYDLAVTSGRIALRIDPKSNAARVIVARGYLGKGAYDKAQKFAEDAATEDPNNQAAADLLSTIKLRQAFNTMSRDTDRKETLATIREALKSAVETRRKYVDSQFDKLGTPDEASVIPYSDAALAAGRYSAALNVLEPVFKKDNRRTDVANRIAFAEMRLGRYADALNTLNELKKYGQPDAYSYAALAVLFAEAGDPDGSDAALKDALISGPDDPAVLSAQAYLALKFVRHTLVGKTTLLLNYDDIGGSDVNARAESRKTMRSALDQLEKASGQRSTVSFFASALNNKLEEFGRGTTYFERAVLDDPLNVDAYVEQGNRSLGTALNGKPSPDELDQRLGAARAYYEAALAARPDSAQALAGLSLVSSMEKKYDEGIRWGEAATAAGPSYAAGYVVLGTAYNLAAAAKRAEADAIRKQSNAGGTTNAERQANELKARQVEAQGSTYARLAREVPAKATKLDPRLEGYELTRAVAGWRYLYTGGRVPTLPQPK